jgi:ABC-2 type transport system ATP-binding protein
MQEPQICIEVKDLVKTYKQGELRALDGVNLTILKGEVFGLIGPNGAGKSTLIGCLLGLLRPDAGTVTVLDKPADFLSIRRITGYVPERPDFENWMTGRLFLKYHHMLAGQSPANMQPDIEETLRQVELDPSTWDRRLGTYSRGMLQRLSLAQCLIGKPQLLLLDEPTLGLDPTGVAIVRKLVTSFRKTGVTAIINSHQLDEVERECDRVAFMRQGKIEQVENLRSSPIGSYVLFVRWGEHEGNGGESQEISTIAQSLGIGIKEANRCWARFVVTGGNQAATLIKALVGAGIPVEEAVSERARLEKLFEKKLEHAQHE